MPNHVDTANPVRRYLSNPWQGTFHPVDWYLNPVMGYSNSWGWLPRHPVSGYFDILSSRSWVPIY